MNKPHCIAIMGATATGKSDLAIRIAKLTGGEIISMDSRQVYRGMDIGTAKPTPEERNRVSHHLIDILDVDEFNSAGRHAGAARNLIESIRERGSVPVLVGGTGLYFRATLEGLIDLSIAENELRTIRASMADKETASLYEELKQHDPARVDELSPRDRMRITRALEIYLITGEPMSDHIARGSSSEAIPCLKIILTLPRWDLRDRIAKRAQKMFSDGWIEEVSSLLRRGYTTSSPGINSLGYKEIAESIINGGNPWNELERVITLTRQYAKRQETFFRREKDAHYFDISLDESPGVINGLIGRWFDLKNNLT